MHTNVIPIRPDVVVQVKAKPRRIEAGITLALSHLDQIRKTAHVIRVAANSEGGLRTLGIPMERIIHDVDAAKSFLTTLGVP